MTVKEFLDKYDGVPYEIIEVAEIATKISDDELLRKTAKDLIEHQDKFMETLSKTGFEFG